MKVASKSVGASRPPGVQTRPSGPFGLTKRASPRGGPVASEPTGGPPTRRAVPVQLSLSLGAEGAVPVTRRREELPHGAAGRAGVPLPRVERQLRGPPGRTHLGLQGSPKGAQARLHSWPGGNAVRRGEREAPAA